MKRLMIAAALLLSAPAAAAGPMETLDAFIKAFNAGDTAAVVALHDSGDVTIVDEIAPHIWQGKAASSDWLASLSAHDAAAGRTDGAVAMAKPQVLTVEGDCGYAVAPVVYTFKEKGVAMREPATMTFALHRTGGVWRIAGWSWNGTVPQPAGK